MNKSFKAIFWESISALRKSLLTLIWIYLGWMFFISILGSLVSLMGGKETFTVLFASIKNPAALNVTKEQSGAVFLWGLFISGTFYLTCFWAILVIRNKILSGQSLIIEAFIEFCRKLWKIIFVNVLLVFVEFAALFVSILLFNKWFLIIFIPFFIFIGPMCFTSLYGILCQNGKFWKIIVQNISLGYHNWLNITVKMILLQLTLISLIILLTCFDFIFRIMGINIVVNLTETLFTIFIATFLPCFATVLYLNVTGLKPQETAFKQNATKIITRSN
ncbi:MAG: hypothetical protein J5594_04175 [Elusimicrobiaceae bacterium]|nr:hypothetical protein [Elusimicrobiaceae bacterium]